MRYTVLSILLLAGTLSLAQLPKKWMGKYKGELTSVNLAGQESQFGMELHISEKEDSTYNFTIIYTSGETKQERAYQLIPDGDNHFMLDEKNGIILDMSLGKDRLTSFFEVQGSYLHVNYIFTKKGLRFELTSSSKAEITGGIENEEGEKIPEVQSYKTISFQFASLKKQKK